MEFKPCLHFFPAFSFPKGWGTWELLGILQVLKQSRWAWDHAWAVSITRPSCQSLGRTPSGWAGTTASQRGVGAARHLAAHAHSGQPRRLPGEASQTLPRFPAYDLNSSRSTARAPLSLVLVHRDAAFFSWRGLNWDPIHSWAVVGLVAPLPGGEEGEKSMGHELQKLRSFSEEAEQLLLLLFFSTGQVGKNLKPKQKVQLSGGG